MQHKVAALKNSKGEHKASAPCVWKALQSSVRAIIYSTSLSGMSRKQEEKKPQRVIKIKL